VAVSGGAVFGACAGLGVCALGLWLGFRRLRLWRRVADTPTQKVRSVAMGVAELKGLAQPLGDAQTGPFSGAPCCWWRITVEREVTTRDSKGRTRKRWRQIHSASSEAPFQLADADAAIDVLPQGAEVDAPRVLSEITPRGFGGLFGGGDSVLKGPEAAAWATEGFLSERRRLREWQIGQRRPLYVLGWVGSRPGPLAPAVGAGRGDAAYIISTRDEAELIAGLRWQVLGWFFLAFIALLGALWAFARIVA
jgi:hypothetical protein